jgi:DNA-binding NtrC family response regulator
MIIDDDKSFANLLSEFFFEKGYHTKSFLDAEAALKTLAQENEEYHLIICDLNLPGVNGIQFIEHLRGQNVMTPIIIVTASGSIEKANKALDAGASDYITKPLNLIELGIVSKRALRIRNLEINFKKLQERLEFSDGNTKFVGTSKEMHDLKEILSKVAKSTANVLICGETGTGKDLAAQFLHDESNRSKGPFVAINCSAIPEDLLEAELFGYEKGAFTGADKTKAGLFEKAHKGTLFLDEIGDMPLKLQAKVLRVIQDRKIKAVGSNTYKEIDIRIVSATHQDLSESVNSNQFREDLYFRLSVVPITIPPLRKRKNDILVLAHHFLKKFNHKNNKEVTGFHPNCARKLQAYNWPGNVRELENSIERAVVLAQGSELLESDFHFNELIEKNEAVAELFQKLPPLKQLEAEYIRYVLQLTNGHKEKASKILGIDRKTLYRREKENLNH